MVEAVIIILLVGVFSIVIAFYIREGVNAWSFLTGQKSMAMSTRSALMRVTREIRRVNRNTNITTHASKEITFRDVYDEVITFSQSGSNLMRNADILLEDLRDPCGLNFTYLDANGSETAIPNQMSVVRCRLVAEKGENKFAVESSARVRIKRIK